MKRLLQELTLLVRYSAAGITFFIIELTLLHILLSETTFPYYVSVGIAFVISITGQYGFCHWWVFQRSKRRMDVEYFYFAFILVSGLIIAVGLVSFLVQTFAISVILARAISGIFTGLWDFYLNARFNFRAHPFLKERIM